MEAIYENYNRNEMKSIIVTFLINFYFFLTPFDFAFSHILPGGAPLKFVGILIILIMILYSLKHNKTIKINLIQIFMLLWVFMAISSLVWSQAITRTSLDYLFNYINFGMLFVCFSFYSYSNKQVDCFLKSTLAGTTLASIILLINPVTIQGTSNRFSLSLFGVQNDPNDFAISLAMSTVIAFYYLLYRKKRGLMILIIGINSVALFLTGSRSGIVAFLISLIVLLYDYFYVDKQKKKSFKKIMLVSLIFMLSMALINLLVPEHLVERVINPGEYSTGSGRTEIWSAIYMWIIRNPFIGHGVGALENLSINHFGVHRASHNAYLNLLLEVGIIGFVFFHTPILLIIKKAIKRNNLLALAILTIGLIASFFLEGTVKRFLWNSIMISYIVVNSSYDSNEGL